MNEEDRRLSFNERDASPERWQATQVEDTDEPHPERIERRITATDDRDPQRPATSSSASSTSSNTSTRRPPLPTSVSRLSNRRDNAPNLSRHPTALSRIQTARSQHSNTIGVGLRSRTITRQSRTPMPNFGAGKPFPPPLPDREEFVVEFDGPDDPIHAQNWPLKKKLPVTIVLGFVTLTAVFGSSIFSAAIGSIGQEYGISTEVGILGVSLYLLGFAVGPVLWAPMSELYGRKYPLLISSFGFSIFNIAVATGKDLQTIFICRFFAGFMGGAPVAVVGAVFADMFNNRQRGLAVAIFSMAVFGGPLLAPFIGGFIDMSSLGWRWTEYITAIMGFLGFGLLLLFIEETYPPIILVNKAADLRRRTKNWGIHAKQEEIEVDFKELIEKNLSRPIRMLSSEPIVLALSLYTAFVYGLIYLFLSFYPIVFQEIHGMNAGVGSLPLLGIIVGEMCSGAYMMICLPAYNRKLEANHGIPVPEWRMPPAIIGGVAYAIGLIWYGWAGYRADIPWIAPTLSGLFTGFGLMTIFLQCLNYLIDAYLMFSASAIAANTFLRSLAGAGFPLFARQMIHGMGVEWAGTLLGCVAFVLVPLPVLFWLKGDKIRARSAFAQTLPMASQASGAVSESDVEKDAQTGSSDDTV